MEIRLNCENCDKPLPNGDSKAMICTFDCTFCKDCVEQILFNVCPNCGGGFEKRPTRPKQYIKKHPPSDKRVFKPIDLERFEMMLEKFRGVDPSER